MKEFSNVIESVNIMTNNPLASLLKVILISVILFYGATFARQQDGLPKSYIYFLGSMYVLSLIIYIRDRRNSLN
ncbi:hypothetical protein WALSEDRAFT_59665 [Wallemia mellicola CBS 633.66]|uniref:Uncharacterized protein n=1 Tax=Wallemia mellicola (strain ATCC MYA-4683 / CBS 633.66) TaxID=671144 RepID=I4YFZ0_WALMC|nr:hypothetical protein WALSEDRAFT_59665 [Wallemia mellicola CBS 633.66]EIM22882.1 hypothetical protein WALSEDRAFT_59665 [Wallemia mellicola CBS 633.66]|eukprot:XP_006956931.1 hypothetical protein WALSEDRAFT_59665 [Wallemia mellicola CBS 633.66]